jgi:large subunit ribosomal protein LP2
MLGSFSANVEEDRLDLLFMLLQSKDIAELAKGREQLAYTPSVGTAAVDDATASTSFSCSLRARTLLS